MNKKDICIATITLARNDEEENVLQKSLKQLAELQIPVLITDGGSSTHFIDFLRSIPSFTLLQAKARGVWEQAKNSLLAAYQTNTKYILYTEPDKFDFFRNHLPNLLAEITHTKQTGVFLASRSKTGFATFPAFQQMTETTINNCCEEILGQKLDYTYGPFLMRRELAPYLELVQEDIGWGWRPYTFGLAHRLGYKVEAYISDFTCPINQRDDSSNERIYRMRQLTQNIQGIVLSTHIQLE